MYSQHPIFTEGIAVLSTYDYQTTYTPVHTIVVGSGFHLPFAPHTALILPAGTNLGLHLKNISAPSVVF